MHFSYGNKQRSELVPLNEASHCQTQEISPVNHVLWAVARKSRSQQWETFKQGTALLKGRAVKRSRTKQGSYASKAEE